MARSLVSGAPLRILDEPTAALDPLSESRVYSQFEQISQGKTTIFISHRLGSTKLADTIYVLAEGRIAEQGSHSALLAEGGLYADMFSAQAGWYTDKAEEGETLYA
jgi:ATP-binding cassette subfamily B protein